MSRARPSTVRELRDQLEGLEDAVLQMNQNATRTLRAVQNDLNDQINRRSSLLHNRVNEMQERILTRLANVELREGRAGGGQPDGFQHGTDAGAGPSGYRYVRPTRRASYGREEPIHHHMRPDGPAQRFQQTTGHRSPRSRIPIYTQDSDPRDRGEDQRRRSYLPNEDDFLNPFNSWVQRPGERRRR